MDHVRLYHVRLDCISLDHIGLDCITLDHIRLEFQTKFQITVARVVFIKFFYNAIEVFAKGIESGHQRPYYNVHLNNKIS